MVKNKLVKGSMVAALSVCVVLSFSSNTLACACCAEHGTYSLWTGTPDSYRLGLLKDLKFGPAGDLYMTDAGFDGIRGLSALEEAFITEASESFDIVDVYTNNVWQLDMKDSGGRTGTLVLPRPAKMTIFKVDIHEVEVGKGEARLYKEFRFNGNVGSGRGFFKSSIVRPTTYSLVFQGRGNGCDNATDFTHWRLEIKGSKANYAFFGRMAPAE